MQRMKKMAALLCAVAMLITCAITGTALPVAAESANTFKLSAETLYLGDGTSSWSLTAAVKALNLDGTDYTAETLTWTSSNSAITTAAIDTNTVRVRVKKGLANGTKTTITFTSSSGESHSCDVIVAFDGEMISGGDFESVTLCSSSYQWGALINGGASRVTDPDDPTKTNHVLKLPASLSGQCYYRGLPIVAGGKYKVAFDIKGIDGSTGSVFFVYTGKKVSVSNTKNMTSSSGWYGFKTTATEWTHVEFDLTAGADYSTSDANYIFNFKNAKTAPLYLDNFTMYEYGTAESILLNASDVSMEIGDELELSVTPTPADATYNRVQWSSSDEQVAVVDKNGKVTAVAPGTAIITAKSGVLTTTCSVTVYEEMLAAIADPTLQNGAIETDGAFGEVEAEDIVTVTVTPDEGYLMVPGSLRYENKAGETVYVLNKDFTDGETFGQGDGNTFQFVMPNEKVVLTADFVAVAEQDFAANTIGTSCRYELDENGEKVYDGIRFLTRLNLANKFDDNSNTLTVTYGGAEYTVLEFGSLLKREQNTTKLTYDNAVANAAASGVNRMWISKAYTKDSGNFVLVDYTESYLDFSSVMLTKFYDRFYTACGYIRLQAADESVVTLEFDEITNSISSVVPILPPVQELEGVTAEKECWTPIAHTVAPNEKITYEINVTAGETAGTVTVFEPIPANTVYVEGADKLVGKTAVWELDLAANETKTLTYTVQVQNSLDLCEGGTVVATTAQVGEQEIACDHTLYIERIVNSADEYYVNNAILALEDSTFKDLAYVRQVYNVSYSNSYTGYRNDAVYSGFTAAEVLQSVIHGDGVTGYSYINESGKKVTGSTDNRDNVAPTLYGGTEVTGAISGLKGAPAAQVRESDLMVGDVIIVKNDGKVALYIYCAKGLKLIKPTGGTEAADIALLNTLTQSEAYIVFRPRTGLKSSISVDPEEAPARESYTPEQAALINTAEAYLMRGQKVQYADTKFGYTGTTKYDGVANEYRWRLREDAPEDCTVDYTKYINCSTFCFDSYYFGLGYRLFNKNESYTCAQMVANSASSKDNLREFYFTRDVEDVHTDEEKQQVEEQFMSTIQPGDLLIILRANESSNHVMMYLGNGKMIHATGATYRYNTNGKGAFDQVEAGINYHQVWDYFFRDTSSNYAFGTKLTTLCVVRPLNAYKGEIPENTINRMQNLQGIVAQKLSSHRAANTVSAGDTVTFTFDLRNTNDEAKTLDITDTVPANTTYVTGAQQVDGETLSWKVTVPANTTVQVSYTVRVDADAPKGTELATVAKIGGVKFDCPAVTVSNTLTEEQQAALTAALAEIKAEGTALTNLDLVNEVYARAGLGTAFADTDLAVVTLGDKGVFTVMPDVSTSNYLLATDTAYSEMLVPTMYGGNRVYTPLWDHDRTRMPAAEDLMVGDVIVWRTTSSKYVTYLYTGGDTLCALATAGNDTMSVQERMASLLGRYTYETASYYFAVLRPSMTMEVAE